MMTPEVRVGGRERVQEIVRAGVEPADPEETATPGLRTRPGSGISEEKNQKRFLGKQERTNPIVPVPRLVELVIEEELGRREVRFLRITLSYPHSINMASTSFNSSPRRGAIFCSRASGAGPNVLSQTWASGLPASLVKARHIF